MFDLASIADTDISILQKNYLTTIIPIDKLQTPGRCIMKLNFTFYF